MTIPTDLDPRIERTRRVVLEATAELIAYKQALKNFRAQLLDKAELDFFNLNRLYPHRFLYQVYLERIAFYRSNPPGEDWDGVFTHTSK